jgi:hypothetical protein
MSASRQGFTSQAGPRAFESGAGNWKLARVSLLLATQVFDDLLERLNHLVAIDA